MTKLATPLAKIIRTLSLLTLIMASFTLGLLYKDYLASRTLPPDVGVYITDLFCPQQPPIASAILPSPEPVITNAPRPTPTPKPAAFTGPELFSAINKRRVEYGVNALGGSDELCSIASFRLNQLLPTGTIDNHAGFIEMTNDPNSPFAWIFDKYNVAEFLVFLPSGSATDAVKAWDDTLGHRILLNGGQFTIGCAYASRGIGVAIAGY